MLRSLPDNLRIGREAALLGSYDDALMYYEGAVQQVRQLLRGARDFQQRDRLEQTRTEVVEEISLVKEILQELSSMKVRPFCL